jgi:ankyrin repeat protein
MPEDAAITRTQNLANTAQISLLKAGISLHDGLIDENASFTIVKEWIHESPSQYKDYLESFAYRLTRTITFAFWLISKGTSPLPGSERTTSFRSILGYDVSTLEIEPGRERDFYRYVRSHGCVNRPDDTLYLTLLQVAAIKGDLPLVKTLVGELGAKVDEVGVTPGMTALWLSCMFGNIDIAIYLADKGARVKCRDNISGRSILHFLNQARSTEDMGLLFKLALQSGLGLEDKDKEGNTPLLSTFVGWDFSLGAISNALVCLPEVNLLVKSERNWTALSAAVAKLDLDLVQAITERLPASQLRVSSNLNILSTTVEGELVESYSVLLVHNEFHRRRACGSAAKQVLQGIVDALINDRMQVTMRNSEVGRGTNPLIGACHTGYDDMVIAVLNTPACPDVDDVDETNGMSALHWAAEQGRYVSFVALLERGALPTLRRTADECNPFHHGAVFAPTMLLKVIESIESGKVSLANSLDMEQMMNIPNSDGFRIFDLAVIEGSADHLKLAENLRTRYCIAFDDLIIPTRHEAEEGSRMTLLGYLVSSSVRSNIMEIESLEYMLSLSPHPRFIATTAGTTLLHLAADGFFHGKYWNLRDIRIRLTILDDMSSNPVGYIVLRLLLQRFPGKEFLYHADDQGLTPLHRAAYFGNAVAIDIIQSHVQGRGEQLDWNRLSSAGTTPLDHVGNVRGVVRVSEEDHRALHAILKKNTIRCFLKLRELGGQYSKELSNTIPVA